ncbi:MAG TPA: TRAM domain-containing protein [Gemmatimonadales bacterium]|nr:TRAM domain-containing protein [Gemmatimonadales bacterium]
MTAPVRVLRVAAGGEGVGKLPDGRTVFIPRTAPGDLVALADVELRKRFARARIGEVVEPAPDRVAPRCVHYDRDRCGGCQLQHLSPDAQRAAKRAIVGDALRRIGGIDVADPEVEPSPSAWGYRNKLTLAVEGGRIGLHPLDAPTRVFDLERCEIVAPALQELWSALSPLRRSLPADAERIVLRVDRDGGRHVIVECPAGTIWAGGAELGRRLAASGMAVTVWWRPEGGAARVVSGSADAYPATVFEQVNPALGDAIRRYAVECAEPASGERVWDLYAGIGETTELLLERGAVVDSVELDRRAVEQGQRRSRFGPPPGSQAPGGPVERHAGRVEDQVGRLPRPAVVVTNPPRVGMEPAAVAAIAAARPRRIVYVSCDPATLARDVARLGGGYRVRSVRAFDLFPQTAHVETVLVLEAA